MTRSGNRLQMLEPHSVELPQVTPGRLAIERDAPALNEIAYDEHVIECLDQLTTTETVPPTSVHARFRRSTPCAR